MNDLRERKIETLGCWKGKKGNYTSNCFAGCSLVENSIVVPANMKLNSTNTEESRLINTYPHCTQPSRVCMCMYAHICMWVYVCVCSCVDGCVFMDVQGRARKLNYMFSFD